MPKLPVLALALCALGGAASAQTLIPSGDRFVRAEAGHPIAPGAYAIVPGHSGLCLTSANLVMALPAARTPYITQATCPAPSPLFSVGQVELVALGGGGDMLQPAGGGCATVARGVVFGPSSIDAPPCGSETGFTRTAAETANWFVQRAPAAMISVVETPAVDFAGLDAGPPAVGLTLAQCKARCADDLRRRALSFVPVANSGRTACWLKTGLPTPSRTAAVAAAIVRVAP